MRCVEFVSLVMVCFFFKQKTAYEMRISDWSSDVCSSDLPFRKDGRWFYSRTVEGQQYPILCRTAVEPPADLPESEPVPGEEVRLDMNVLAVESDDFAMGAYDIAQGQDLLLYSTDHDGSDRYTTRIRDRRPSTALPHLQPEPTTDS